MLNTQQEPIQSIDLPFMIDDYGLEVTEARILPLSDGSNLIIGYLAYTREMQYRRERLREGLQFDIPLWHQLKPYYQHGVYVS